jgi:hypothetical protein
MQPDSPDLHGGAAPADRQCQFTKSDGFRCRDWALRGHQHCFRHHQYLSARPDNPIDVPLLEDEDSLASLLSQTLRALAWGTIPAANGRAILAGCRIMQGMLDHRLAKAKFHAKLRSLGLSDTDIVETESELFEREPIDEPEIEPEVPPSVEPGVRTSASDPAAAPDAPPRPNPASIPVPRFPGVRKEWDQGLHRAEQEMTELTFPHRATTHHPFAAARAASFTAPTPEQLAEIRELVAAQSR